jgi:hypothetical protein
MVTEFGKILKEIRCENNQLLYDMSIILDTSTTYLEAVELGKRPIDKEWIDILINKYKLDKSTTEKLNYLKYKEI